MVSTETDRRADAARAGGGGGAGAVGATGVSTDAGAGGIGSSYSIGGSAVYCAGGGGGGQTIAAGPGGTLSGTKTEEVNTETGVATFTDLSIDKAGIGYTLTATGDSASTTPGVVVSEPFDVSSPSKLTPAITVSLSESITYGTASVTLSGTVAAGGVPAQDNEQVSVTINGVAKLASGPSTEWQATLTASAGGVSGTVAIPAGATMPSVKPRFYLRQNIPITGSGKTIIVDLGSCKGGDIDGNNQVDGTDYAWLRYWRGTTADEWHAIAGDDLFPDLNGDGVIDSKGYDVLKEGWYQQGAALP